MTGLLIFAGGMAVGRARHRRGDPHGARDFQRTLGI